jgi:Domain of unknown function (DUF222)/HNH endonuclease
MDIEGREATAVDHALDAVEVATAQLIKLVEDGGLDSYDDAGLIGFLQRFERARNRTALVDHRAVRDVQSRRLPEKLTQQNVAGVLSWALRLSRGEAGRRVRAAEQVGERVTMTGEPLAPLRPALAAAQRAGDASPEQVDVCVRAIASVDHRGFDPADLDAADQLLAGFTRTFEPQQLRDLAAQVVERIDPDGSVPQDKLNSDRRHLAFRKLGDGMYDVEGRLTGTVGAKLQAVLGPLAKPRVENVTLDDGRVLDEPDPRHHGQRTHDALEEVCDRLLRSGTLPDSGGTPATVIITTTQPDLHARNGSGTTSDGTRLSTDAVLGLADQADVVTVVLSPLGAVLDLGRTRRCASPTQTLALIARDLGCSFPGCQRPPEWCERHHVVAWIDGGLTTIDNLTLLCSYHHHNFAARGWTCLMTDGLPTWTPPRWIDREQRPLRNTRISARQLTDQLRQ